MVKKIFIIWSLIVSAMCTSVSADALYKTEIRQIYCFKDLLRVYADIEDKNSQTVEIPSQSDIDAHIDGTKLTVKNSVRFSETDSGTADIFLVDISGSIRDNQMQQVKNSIKTWAADMKPQDKMAIITFGNDVTVMSDYSDDKNVINASVDNITNNDNNTRLYGGLKEALRIAQRADAGLPKRKNIILISDGVNDYSGGISENDIYTELKNALIPVYSMRMSNSKADNSKGLATLNSVAEYSGGDVYDMSGKDIGTVCGQIRSRILNSCVIDFTYDGTEPDNNLHTLNLKIKQNDVIAECNTEFVMKKSSENSGTYQLAPVQPPAPAPKDARKARTKIIIIAAALGVVLAALISLLIVLLTKKKDTKASYPPPSFNYNGTADDTDTVMVQEQSGSYINVVFHSMQTGETAAVRLYDAVTVGRNASNDFVINNPVVSGRHAVIRTDGRDLYIEDCNTLNGTLLNGKSLSAPSPLANGSIVTFGNAEYRIEF